MDYDKQEAERYWESIGLVVNNDPSLLHEVRRIYQESLRLSCSTKPRNTFQRNWYYDLIVVIKKAWRILLEEDSDLPKEPILCDCPNLQRMNKLYFNALLGESNPALKLFEYVYTEKVR